jgi:hypothetical protein
MGGIGKVGSALVVLLIVGTAPATVRVRAQTGPGPNTSSSRGSFPGEGAFPHRELGPFLTLRTTRAFL